MLSASSQLQELIEWCEFVLQTLDDSELEAVRKMSEEVDTLSNFVRDFYNFLKQETESYEPPDISGLDEKALSEVGNFISLSLTDSKNNE